MADIRTLKLQLLADTAQFSTGLNKAQDDTQNFTNKIDTVVANAAKAFLGLATAVGTAAFAIGVSAVKAAIEDEKAQASLAQTLRNTTQATDEQIAATEEYIDATQRATAVGDDQLRPSLQRLLISTNDLAKAQQLQKLALDVAAGSGKSLEEVSNILAKAYDGNFKALKNLGVELKTTTTSTKTLKVSKEDLAKQELNNESASLRVASAQERLNKVLNNSKSDALDVQKAQNSLEKAQLAAAEASDKYNKIVDKQGKTIKVTKEEAVSFDEIVRQLTGLFEGQAAVAAGTFAGRMDLIKIAVNEAQEQIGFALLPLLEKLAKFATDSLIPALEGLVNGLTRSGKQGLTRAFYDAGTGAITFGYDMETTEGSAYLLGEQIRQLGDAMGKLLAIDPNSGESSLVKLIDLMTKLVEKTEAAINAYKRFSDSFVGGALLDISLQPLRTAGAAGSALLGGSPGQIINVNNTFGATNSKAQANTVVKSINNAAKAGTVNKFVKPMIPGR
jgi:hypothetical protein